jgi:hypothetical protein
MIIQEVIPTHPESTPTYVNHVTGMTYCGDKMDENDYDVTNHVHPLDGRPYKYIPESQSWTLSYDFQWNIVRAIRDEKINDFQWKINRQRDRITLNTATADSLLPLLNYVQSLRDIPETQEDPFNITWPDEPTI